LIRDEISKLMLGVARLSAPEASDYQIPWQIVAIMERNKCYYFWSDGGDRIAQYIAARARD
jgi:hypothetical protein